MKEPAKFTLRIPKALHEKLQYMADSNCRSKNKEIETAIKRYIRDFEVLNGSILIKEKSE